MSGQKDKSPIFLTCSLKQAVVRRVVVIEEKAHQIFILIWKSFICSKHPLSILNTIQWSVSGTISILIVFPVLEDNALLQWALLAGKAVMLKLTNSILSLPRSLPKYCSWNHYSQNKAINMSLNTLQDKHSSATARDFILLLTEPAHIVDNQPMLAK